jgi:hypothetical protein
MLAVETVYSRPKCIFEGYPLAGEAFKGCLQAPNDLRNQITEPGAFKPFAQIDDSFLL